MGRVCTSRSFGVSEGTATHERAMERTSTLVDGGGFGWGVRGEVWRRVANRRLCFFHGSAIGEKSYSSNIEYWFSIWIRRIWARVRRDVGSRVVDIK